MEVNMENDHQEDRENLFRSIRKEQMGKETYRKEVVDTIEIEKFSRHDTRRNRHFIIRVQQTIEYVGFDTQAHANYEIEILGNRLVLWHLGP